MTKYTLIIDVKIGEVLRDIIRNEADNSVDAESEYLHDLADMLDDLKSDWINDLTA